MSLLDNASLLLTPNAVKASKLYSVIPSNGNGDFTATRATTATRINPSGLVESVALNVPRLDYSLGGCPNILLEPQRTNLALQSSSFDSASWSKIRSAITANTTTSPSGVLDADTWTGDGTSGAKYVIQTASIVSGTTYTISIYAKKNTNNFIQLFGGAATFGVNAWANFDLNSGVVGSVGSSATASIQSVGNGWYRCIVVTTATITTTGNAHVVGLITSATSPANEVNTLSTSVFIWGAQLEAGAYATSFIPTTTASVTRVQDQLIASGISSLIGQTEGTILLDIYFSQLTSAGIRTYFSLEGNVINQFSAFAVSTSNNGNTIAYAGLTYPLATGRHKCAFTYSQSNNERKLFVDGALLATSTHTNFLTTIDKISAGCRINPFASFAADRPLDTRNGINLLGVYKEVLSNSELIEYTTL